jgi:diguanylate cyclase (GGDEF)-like protein
MTRGGVVDTSASPVVAIFSGLGEYQLRLLEGIRQVLDAHGVPLLVHADDLFPRPSGHLYSLHGLSPMLVRMLQWARPRGVISLAASAAEEERELVRLYARFGLPTVLIGASVPGCTWVHGDNLTGMRELMTHLLQDRRPDKVALVRGIAHQSDSSAREQVFREELGRHGLSVDEDLVVEGGFHYDKSFRVMRELAARRPDLDAVVAMNDASAAGVVEALTREGRRVPEDVVVTGFDNEEIAGHWPGLTTVDQDVAGQGAAAAEALLAQLAGGPAGLEITLPSRLVVRGSTAPRGQQAVARLEDAVEMAKAARAQRDAVDAMLSMSQALVMCRSWDDVAGALANQLSRLGVERCFLVLYEHGGATLSPDYGKVREHPPVINARLLLDYRDGRTLSPPRGMFPAHHLLPAQLRADLETGAHVIQPLCVEDRELGHVIFGVDDGDPLITEVLRMELSRTLEAVATTEELKGQVMTRRRAEQELRRLNAELERSLMVDGLTQIANRKAFERHLDHHWQLAAERGDEIGLVIIDVDLFKAYNDHYGHLLGDDTLRTVAQCLEQAVREPTDLACRYGGEEFAVVLPSGGLIAATAVAERFRSLLAAAAVPHDASTVAKVVTASLGIAVLVPAPGESATVLVEAADQALYRAKGAGRSAVAVAPARAAVQAD